MNDLLQSHCVPCEGTEKPLTNDAEEKHMKQLSSGWTLDRKLTHQLIREVKFASFNKAISTVNEIGKLAESEGHHPNLYIHDYNMLRIELYTHAIGGLSLNDFILAVKIDAILKT